MCAILTENDVMTPESSEGRERITRLEERVESNRRQIEMLGPLPLQVGLVQRGQDDLRDDLHQFEKRIDERFEKFEQSMQKQVLTCVEEIGRLSRDREQEKKDERADRSTDKTSRRAMWGLIGAAAVTGIFSLVIQVIQAVGG